MYPLAILFALGAFKWSETCPWPILIFSENYVELLILPFMRFYLTYTFTLSVHPSVQNVWFSWMLKSFGCFLWRFIIIIIIKTYKGHLGKVARFIIDLIIELNNREGGRGHWTVYYTSLKSFIITFSYLLASQLWGLYCTMFGWFISLSVKTFQPLIVIYRKGYLVYYH